MAGILDRLPILLGERLEDLPFVTRNAADPARDRAGTATNLAAGAIRFIGVAQYALNHDIAACRANLLEAAKTRLRLIERFARGEPISPSYVTMMNYKSLFDALASCDMEVPKAIASRIGGRHEIEMEHDHPFDYAFGYTLKAFVLSNPEEMQQWTQKFSVVCEAKENMDFQGYAQVFQGVLERNAAMVENGLKAIVKGHGRQSKGKGVFKDSEDEVLCVWGLGMAKLARAYGLSVDGEPPLIPNDLLC
jgi:hypothetical protein